MVQEDLMTATQDLVSDEIYVQVQRFMFHEAALLDRRQYKAWLGLLADDMHYVVTAQLVRDGGAEPIEYAIIDENRVSLTARVEQIASPKLTHAENPPTFVRRFVSNIEVSPGDKPDEVLVDTNLLVYRNRETVPNGGLYVGQRRDVIRRGNGAMRLARRHFRLDQFMIFDGAVSPIF
jgi:3-phenylpropionate/cinnamic acid dioxygenase small subunit